jgi:uncharacterized protein YjeT (DUF2065 family)
MTTTTIILYTLGVIALLEGAAIAIIPNQTKKIVTKIIRNTSHIRKLGTMELILGIILLVIASIL